MRRRSHEFGRVVSWKVPCLESHPGVEESFQPVYPERAPVVAVKIPADQKPVSLRCDQGVRLDQAVTLLPAGRGVMEADAVPVTTGESQLAEHFWRDRRMLRNHRLHVTGQRVDP